MKVFFFGCWNGPGHFLHLPGGRHLYRNDVERYCNGTIGLDGTLAPKRSRRGGGLCWVGMGASQRDRQNFQYDAEECPQGQFLRHELDTGYTVIQWWDRTQGDERGACNSTFLAEGRHASDAMVVMLRERFPHVVANLEKAGIQLVEVFP